jgi:hypothetical protein
MATHSYSRSRGRNFPNLTLKAFSSFRLRTLWNFLKIFIPFSILFSFLGLYIYEPHLELAFYSRQWVHQEVEHIAPLSGCFEPGRVSGEYDVNEAVYGKKRIEVQAGMPLRMGLDCYAFAGTVQGVTGQRGSNVPPSNRTTFHTYWRVDLAPFGPRQEWMLKSFFATQDLRNSRLILWSNGDLSSNRILSGYSRQYPQSFELRVVDIGELAKGTELDGSELLSSTDSKAWLDGDLVRLLLLWSFGGVWVDMDSLLTRDLTPLLDHEFVTQWDCYGQFSPVLAHLGFHLTRKLLADKIYQPFNGALMHFRLHSPYLCEAFHIMASSKPPRPGSTDWGSLLYFKLWRRLVAGSIPPFKVLPFCFSDGRSCRLDNRLPDPFAPDNREGKWTMGLGVEEGGGLDGVLKKVFGVHLHNQWEKEFPAGGWVERLLLKRYEERLGA